MMKRAPTYCALLTLAACSMDIIDHGNGNGGANGQNRDAGPRDAGPRDAGRDGGVTVADAGFADAGLPCALNHSFGSDLGVVTIGDTSTVTFVWRTEVGSCNTTALALDPPAADIAISGPTLPTSASELVVTASFAPSAPGAVETQLRATASGNSGFVWPLFAVGVPSEVPSSQTVTFDVTNTSTLAVYVMTEGTFCDAFDVGVSRNLGFQCGCECPPPPKPHGRVYVRVDPGMSHTITWDARALVEVPYTEHCALPVSDQTAPRVAGVPQPAVPGSYSVDVAYETTIPDGCSVNGMFLECDTLEPAEETPPLVAELCPATQLESVAFTLPATGDVTVPVAIGP